MNSDSCLVLARFELGDGRPFLREPCDLRGHGLLDLLKARTGPGRGLDDEDAGDLAGDVERRHGGGQLLVVDERLVQTRREAVGEDAGGDVRSGVVCWKYSGVGHPIRRARANPIADLDDLLRFSDHPPRRTFERRSGRDIAEYFCTRRFASAGSKSPATTSDRLLGE